MKTPLIVNKAMLLVTVAVILIHVTSCRKDEKADKPADYVGTWICDKTVDSEDGSFVIRDVVTFSKNSFTEVAKIQDTDGNWLSIIGRKGNFTPGDGKMDVSLTEAGMTGFDSNGNPTGNIVYYKAGTSEFSDVLVEMEMSQHYKAQYSVAGSSLTLTADTNDNGSYDDEDVYVFAKQ